MHSYFENTGPHILAHQGLAIECTPNTLESFTKALAAGADYIETDAHGTKDGIAVLFHDDDINGVPISSLISTELPNYIPTLTSALERFPHVKFNIDIKNSEASVPVANAINKLNVHQRILLTSFDAKRRKATMQKAPGTASSPSVREFTPAFIAALCGQQWLVNRLLRNFDAVQIPASALGLNIVSPRLVKTYHKAGVMVHVWTINDPEHMKKLLAAGVNGIVTDRADIAVTLLKN